ncbi:unnamed protein product [Musa acuminata subsp. burmannicoides]
MALQESKIIAILVAFLGSLSFIFAIIAENKKPTQGIPIQGKNVVICKYPSDPSVALGILSLLALLLSAIVGHVAVYFPYKGKSVPSHALFRSAALLVFFIIAEAISALALAMMMWVTITEGLHHSRNVHHDLGYQCPTAKTGLFGGAAFLALDASLFWFICQILTLNARADYLDEEDPEGEYGQVYVTDI